MALRWPYKDPNEVLDYRIDWSARLLTDTIVSSDWTVPSGLTEDSASIEDDDTVTEIWLSSGSLAADYEVLNRVVTAGGRTMDQTVRLRIKTK